MRLYQNKQGKYVVYDKSGNIVIITSNKRVAETSARSIEDGTHDT